MPELFFTADLHLDHPASIIHDCRDRWLMDGDIGDDGKFISEEIAKQRTMAMNEDIISGWNEMVSSKDTVVIVGDFAWKNHSHFLSRLKGMKILIKGNHDDFSQTVAKQFTAVYDSKIIKLPKDKRAYCLHYCCDSWPQSHYGYYHFYGHSHGRKEEIMGRLRCDVGMPVWGYKPVSAEILIAKMEYYAMVKMEDKPAEKERNKMGNEWFNRKFVEDHKGSKN